MLNKTKIIYNIQNYALFKFISDSGTIPFIQRVDTEILKQFERIRNETIISY